MWPNDGGIEVASLVDDFIGGRVKSLGITRIDQVMPGHGVLLLAARCEERECQAYFGATYRDYMAVHTLRFLTPAPRASRAAGASLT